MKGGSYPDLVNLRNDSGAIATYTVVYNLTAYGTASKHKGVDDLTQFINGGQFAINGKCLLALAEIVYVMNCLLASRIECKWLQTEVTLQLLIALFLFLL
jgi:hypothetical protein